MLKADASFRIKLVSYLNTVKSSWHLGDIPTWFITNAIIILSTFDFLTLSLERKNPQKFKTRRGSFGKEGRIKQTWISWGGGYRHQVISTPLPPSTPPPPPPPTPPLSPGKLPFDLPKQALGPYYVFQRLLQYFCSTAKFTQLPCIPH